MGKRPQEAETEAMALSQVHDHLCGAEVNKRELKQRLGAEVQTPSVPVNERIHTAAQLEEAIKRIKFLEKSLAHLEDKEQLVKTLELSEAQLKNDHKVALLEHARKEDAAIRITTDFKLPPKPRRCGSEPLTTRTEN
ncbi:hypothetical protein HGRIS_005084 [Hohenbuehelia grisea]|uniref:Uncharacterized protein n=1 Tax=Hohenbuehelia grisea TaxID=104357 RepID=A0ABR3JEX0_9AGAR